VVLRPTRTSPEARCARGQGFVLAAPFPRVTFDNFVDFVAGVGDVLLATVSLGITDTAEYRRVMDVGSVDLNSKAYQAGFWGTIFASAGLARALVPTPAANRAGGDHGAGSHGARKSRCGAASDHNSRETERAGRIRYRCGGRCRNERGADCRASHYRARGGVYSHSLSGSPDRAWLLPFFEATRDLSQAAIPEGEPGSM
jgi:hypothetical protein